MADFLHIFSRDELVCIPFKKRRGYELLLEWCATAAEGFH